MMRFAEIAAIAGLPLESNECRAYGSPVGASASRFVPVFKMFTTFISARLERTIVETDTNGPRRARTGLLFVSIECRVQAVPFVPGFSVCARFKKCSQRRLATHPQKLRRTRHKASREQPSQLHSADYQMPGSSRCGTRAAYSV
jgi:hypothetical protein